MEDSYTMHAGSSRDSWMTGLFLFTRLHGRCDPGSPCGLVAARYTSDTANIPFRHDGQAGPGTFARCPGRPSYGGAGNDRTKPVPKNRSCKTAIRIRRVTIWDGIEGVQQPPASLVAVDLLCNDRLGNHLHRPAFPAWPLLSTSTAGVLTGSRPRGLRSPQRTSRPLKKCQRPDPCADRRGGACGVG